MDRQPLFIGREKELGEIQSIIEDSRLTQAIFLDGEGGIGKTALLNQVWENCSPLSTDQYWISEVIDFDEREMLIPDNVRRKIVGLLGNKQFEEFMKEWKHLREMERNKRPEGELRAKKGIVRNIFSKNLNEIAQNRRLIFFFDTTDSLPGTEVWDRLKRLILATNNSVFILAGRDSFQLMDTLRADMKENVRRKLLPKMADEDCQEYFRLKTERKRVSISPETEEKIIKLSKGRPILMDLAIEWLSRDISLDWLENASLKQLEEKFDKTSTEFEGKLVRHISKLRSPTDKLILLLARVYPLDDEGVKKFLNLPEVTIGKLYKYVKSLVFVKNLPGGAISLHDEMRRMVNEFVWPSIDPYGTRRLSESNKIIDYLDDKIRFLDSEIKKIEADASIPHAFLEIQGRRAEIESLQKQRTEHNAFRRVLDDYNVYSNAVEKARLAYDFSFAHRIQESIRSLYHRFSEESKYKFELLNGRILYDQLKPEKAKEIFDSLLEKQKNNLFRMGEIYNGLGICEMKLGNLNLALDYQKKALELFEQLGKTEYVPFVANQIGRVYTGLGRLEEAISFFNTAFKVAKTLDRNDKTLDVIAGIMDYWGYALGMQGKYPEAIENCDEAISIWIRLKEKTEKNPVKEKSEETRVKWISKIARGEATKGAVCRMLKDYESALDCLKYAVQHYRLPNDSELLIKAYSDLGFTYHIMGTKPVELKEAQAYLENGMNLVESRNEQLERPLLRSRLARVYWMFFQNPPEDMSTKEIDEYKLKARTTNQIALREAHENEHFYAMAKCIVGWAEFDDEDDKASKEKIPDYARELEELLSNTSREFPLFQGRMNRIQAEQAFKNEQLDQALEFYKKGIWQINTHGGYGVYSIEKELERLADRIKKLSPEIAEEWINALNAFWKQKDEPGSDKYSRLENWHRKQQIELMFRK